MEMFSSSPPVINAEPHKLSVILLEWREQMGVKEPVCQTPLPQSCLGSQSGSQGYQAAELLPVPADHILSGFIYQQSHLFLPLGNLSNSLISWLIVPSILCAVVDSFIPNIKKYYFTFYHFERRLEADYLSSKISSYTNNAILRQFPHL